MGRILRAQGLKGELRIGFYWPDPEVLAAERILIDGRETRILRSRWLAPDSAVVACEGIDDRDEAERLVGSEISVDCEWYPENVAPIAGLIGAEVVDETGGPIGVVSDLYDNRAQIILSVETAKGEALVPYVEVFVTRIEGRWPKRITLRPIPGLLPE